MSEAITNLIAAYDRWNDREDGSEDDLHHAVKMLKEEPDLERLERIAADTKKVFHYSKHTGEWSWTNRYDIWDPLTDGFKTRYEALLDAVEPYLEDEE